MLQAHTIFTSRQHRSPLGFVVARLGWYRPRPVSDHKPTPPAPRLAGGPARRHGPATASVGLLALALAAGWCGVRPACAQDTAPPATSTPTDPLARFEGRQVREVVLRRLDADGRSVGGEEGFLKGEAASLAQNTIRTRVGAAFSASMVNADISRLSSLGQYDLPNVQVTELADTTLRVTFFVRLQPVIRDVQVVGNRAIADEDIRTIVNPLVGSPQQMDQVQIYLSQVERAYKEKGYYGARVKVDQNALESQGVLIFRVREGQKTGIADVRFEGNLAVTPKELKSGLRATAFTLFENNRVNEDDLAADVAKITETYKDRGYYAVRVDKALNVSPDGSEAIVTFIISEGPVYTLRRVTTVRRDGDTGIFSDEQILGLLSIKPGDVYGRRTVDKSVQAVQDAHWAVGHADARVDARELRDTDSPQIDLLLSISEGPFYRTGEVILQGDDWTQHKVARRNITFQPGRPLDRTQERETLRRLENSRIFAERQTRITLQPPDPEDPEFRDVLVEVRETNTGQFAAGGVVSSDGGVGARVSITENNFDITQPPHTFGELFGGAFRGGGQTFNIEASPGDRTQKFAISLAEPSLFDSNFSGATSLFLNRRIYRQYDEVKYGTTFGLGRNFGSRWVGRVPVRFQWSELSNIDTDAPVDYYQVADLALLTSAGISLKRATLDNTARASKGSVTEFSIEQVGALGGEYDFTNIRGEHKVFIPVSEDVLGRRTVLQVASRFSYIPQDSDAVPVFERNYLGGQNFRGFDLRGIGPRGIRNDTGTLGDDPIGGNFSFFLGAELQQPIYEDIFALAFFVDTGTLNTDFSFDDYRVSTGLGFRVMVPGLSPVPLAFDFGFPLIKEDFDEERLFTFSIDVPF